MGNLIMGVIEFALGVFCSVQQMNTTHDSVVSALQGGTLITSHLSAIELMQVLQQNSGKYNTIGWLVAWVTQVFFWGTIMPASPVHNMALHRVAVWVFFGLEVITDIWYSVATGTTLGGVFTFIFTLGGSGIVASLTYVVAMAAGSIFLLIKGIHRLEKAFSLVMAKPATASVKN